MREVGVPHEHGAPRFIASPATGPRAQQGNQGPITQGRHNEEIQCTCRGRHGNLFGHGMDSDLHHKQRSPGTDVLTPTPHNRKARCSPAAGLRTS